MMQHLTTFLSILKEPPLFDDPKDEEACQKILAQCSNEDNGDDVEDIAKTSYAYWFVASKAAKDMPENARTNAALKEIKRHYIGEGRKVDKATAALRTALEYRREYHINDIMRSCFYDEQYNNPGDAELAEKYKTLILEDLKRQAMVVCGVDAHSRTIVYKGPRSCNPAGADEAFLLTQIYTAERAVAVSEFRGQSNECREEKLCVIFNFRDYSSRNSPSKSTLIPLIKVLQSCYPERLGELLILEPPFWMRALFNIMWPFLSRATSEKIKLSRDDLQELLDGAADGEMLEDWINRPDAVPIDVEDYTQQPFYWLDQE